MHQTNVPDECRSQAPQSLRDLAQKYKSSMDPVGQQLLLDTAAEIEGSEEAYAVLVSQISELRKKLAHTEENLRRTSQLLPRTKMLKDI